MPEVWFTLRWPDDTEERCYSPSSIICDYLKPGASYSLEEFRTLAHESLNAASGRVEKIYGHPCSRAMGQLQRREKRVSQFGNRPGGVVTCLQFTR